MPAAQRFAERSIISGICWRDCPESGLFVWTNPQAPTWQAGIAPHGQFIPEELGGLSVKKFCEALRAEGVTSWDGGNFCLHTHPFFKTFDLTNAGVPSRIEYNDRDVREDDDRCKPSENVFCFSVPWFKHFDKEWIERYASAFRKVIENYQQLLEGDADKRQGGRWYGMDNA